jgi:tetratricopeptide (TPR) repeat protein
LNDPKFGPLTLVRANDPKVADVQGFALTTFRTALSANIGAMASGKDAAVYSEAAKALFADIVKVTGDTEEGRKVRFQEFRRLASNLLAQLELAPKEKQAAISNAIQLFLNQVVSESKDAEELLWASAMYQQMIAVVGRDEKGKLNAQGTELADKSNAVLGKLEQTYANQKDEKAAAMQVVVAKKRALVFREMGKFSEAIDIYESILADTKRRNDLVTQEEAAEALQQWGDEDTKMYQKAVMGDRQAKSGKPENVIWGWNKIAQMLNRAGIANNPRFAEMFFRARLETARCVFKRSPLVKEEKKKQNEVQNAAAVIITTYNGHPNLNDPETKKKFDELLKEIQRAQGEALPQGLNGIKQAAPPANVAPANGQSPNAQPANAPPANAEAAPANQ